MSAALSSDMRKEKRPPTLRTPRMLYWTSAAVFVLLVTLGLLLEGPQVESDEGSYLLNAAAIAGRLAANPPNGYHSGYSLLLVPGFLFQASPDRAYHFALLVNALLVAATPLALYRLTRQLWPDSGGNATHAATAIAAACYAPMLLLSQYTMSESALVSAYAWLLANVATTLRSKRAVAAVAAGVMAGFLYLVHARGATIAAPILLAAAAHALAHAGVRREVLLIWLVAALVAMLHHPLEVIAGRGAWGDAHTLHAMLANAAAPANWPWLCANLIGASTTAIATSTGIAVIAACAVGSDLRQAFRRREKQPSVRTTMLVASAISMLFALAVTALFFTPPQRADQMAYGRYAWPTLVPLLAIGLLRPTLSDRTTRLREFAIAIACAAMGIAACAVAYEYLAETAQRDWNYINAIALFLFRKAMPDNPWLAIAAYSCSLAVVLAAVFRRSVRAGIVAYALLQLTIFAVAWTTVTRPGSSLYARGRGVVDAVAAFATTTPRRPCVKLDREIDSWHRTDLSWRLFPYLSRAGGRDCADMTIRPLDGMYRGDERLAAVERGSPLAQSGPIGLYLHSGLDFDAFARVHATIPETAFEPLPVEDRFADVSISAPLPIRLKAGTVFDLTVHIVNRSPRSLRRTDTPQLLPHPVMLGAQLEQGDGDMRLEYRETLPADIAPGAGVDATLRIGPLKQPGRYSLRVGIVQEHVAWFDGDLRATIDVTE